MSTSGTLIFFCGKMGAGKSTLSARIAHERNAVLISEDEWLEALFPDEINDLDAYISYSSRLRSMLSSHVAQILVAGSSVVMDFPGNTRTQRAWFKEIYAQRDIPHELYYLAVADDVCLERLKSGEWNNLNEQNSIRRRSLGRWHVTSSRPMNSRNSI